MKKTLSEVAAQLRECAEIVENSEVLRAEFPEGMTEDQIHNVMYDHSNEDSGISPLRANEITL